MTDAIEYNYAQIDPYTRESIRFIYNYMCLECGKSASETKLDTHHIIPQRIGGMATIDNLIPLCRQCHWKYDPHHTKSGPRPKKPWQCKISYSWDKQGGMHLTRHCRCRKLQAR